jgi:hypothetical protein
MSKEADVRANLGYIEINQKKNYLQTRLQSSLIYGEA